MDPSARAVIGSDYGFRATVTDPDGIKSVVFVLQYPSGLTSTYRASLVDAATGRYGIDFGNFSDGEWAWWVVARDNVRRGSQTQETAPVPFTVDTSGGGSTPPPSDDVVANSGWSAGGAIQTAAGRLYFEMPANRRATRWNGYVCSGTAVTDSAVGSSIVLSAAHCIYDDAAKVFARNVLFIPNQAATSGAGTDLNCDNDPLGCWSPSHGVVDEAWTTRTFPDNIPWDYGYYVVPDAGAHAGSGSDDPLDVAAGTLPVQFSPAAGLGATTHAFGYSYSDDPDFMYCAEALERETDYQDYWLPNCDLSGGSSGGPWIQPMDEDTGSGPVISVNSWGYSTTPGMGSAPLTGNAECVFDTAQTTTTLSEARGVVASSC